MYSPAVGKALKKTSCKYPIRRVEVKVDTVPRGNMNYVQDSMFLGQLPKRLVIGCVDSDALNGTITKFPFDFKHYKINLLVLNVDGRQIPAKPLQPDFENAGYIRSYMRLYTSTEGNTECQSVAYSLCTVVKQDLSVAIFCIQDDVDGPCQSFGEMNLHT
jgi:hypothetical protein